MKSKVALILGLICIAVSAVTLFSVLGHADPAARSLTFLDADGLSSSIKGVSILNNDPRLVRLDVSPMNFPNVGDLSLVFIKFNDEYDASIARDILMKQKMDLFTSYVVADASRTRPPLYVSLVNAEGQFVRGQAPQGALVYPNNLYISLDNTYQKPSLQDLVSEQVRDDQWNKGIYVGAYGKMMWIWDGLIRKCGPNVKSSCHNVTPYTQR